MSNYFLYNYAGTDMYRETHDAKAVATTVTLQSEGTYIVTFTMPESFSEGQPSISTWVM